MYENKDLDRLLTSESPAVVDLCRSLVRIPSEDPPGDTRMIASFIHNLLQENGVESELVASDPKMPNVVARVQGNGPGLHLVFNGHMDTFPVPDKNRWQFDPFGGDIIEGKLYGRGAADMKGGLACCIQSVILLNRVKHLFPGKVSLTCVSDEEVGGQNGSKFLLKTFPELYGDALINGEPSSPYNVRIGEKGQHWYRISCKTSGGHGAYAGLKPNAIRDLWAFIQDLLTFMDESIEVPAAVREMMQDARECYDNLLGPGSAESALRPTVNVGNIKGGTSVNMIPESCEAEVDFRLPPGGSGSDLEEWIRGKADKHPSCEIQRFNSNDCIITDPYHPLVLTMKFTAEEIRKHKVYTTYSLGGTEARLWRKEGIPAITYGPNHYNMASPDEHVYVEELLDVVKAQTLGAFRYLKNKGAIYTKV